jgi:glycosyltransferase involved in cell wall biosynthesis
VTHHLVVPYPSGNSSVRARGLHWIDRLVAQALIEPDTVVVHGPGFGGRDVVPGEPVLLMRNAVKLTRGGREAAILSKAAPGVYDLDDGLPWDNGRLPRIGRWWKRPFPRSLVARRAASAADRVIVGNQVLADWASGWCGDVVIVPTCVEPSEYRPVDDASATGRPPVIGWIGSPATEHYLFDIAPALAEVHRRTGATLQIVSAPGDLPAELAGFTTRRVWEPTATQWIGEWNVGVMPLADGVYERAKCGYKLLQYAASAVPAVGSPVGINEQLLDVMDGLSARSSDEWVEAIVELVTEPADRRRQRKSAALRTADDYSYDRWQARWVAATGW